MCFVSIMLVAICKLVNFDICVTAAFNKIFIKSKSWWKGITLGLQYAKSIEYYLWELVFYSFYISIICVSTKMKVWSLRSRITSAECVASDTPSLEFPAQSSTAEQISQYELNGSHANFAILKFNIMYSTYSSERITLIPRTTALWHWPSCHLASSASSCGELQNLSPKAKRWIHFILSSGKYNLFQNKTIK